MRPPVFRYAPPRLGWPLVATLVFTALATFAQSVPNSPPPASGSTAGDSKATPPDQREIWVPADQLKSVLARFPKAVLLSREEYEKLLRDAGPRAPKPPAPPRPAALVSAQYKARIDGKTVQVTGEIVASVLSDQWAQLPLQFGSLALGEIRVDGDAALVSPPPAEPESKGQAQAQAEAPPPPQPANLLLRGLGVHKVAISFSTPITTDGAWRSLAFQLPVIAASAFTLDLPLHTMVESEQPVRLETLPDSIRATVALPLSCGNFSLRWRSAGDGLVALPPTLENETAFTIDAEIVRAESSLTLFTATGLLPETIVLEIPAGASVAELKGGDVLAWTVQGSDASVQLQPGRTSRTTLGVVLQFPALAGQAQTTVALPLVAVRGVGKVSGHFSVSAGAGAVIRTIVADPAARQLTTRAGAIGNWEFEGLPAPARATIQRLQPRFAADLDTVVNFQPEAIFLDRTLTLHPEEGGLFALLLTLPAGEEVLGVEGQGIPGEEKPLWQVEGSRLSVRWVHKPLGPDDSRLLHVKTRLEPAGWAAGVGRTAPAPAAPGAPAAADSFVFPMAELRIEGAEKVSGYLALRASENFRLETEATDLLEPRDGRTTPVQGSYAWFRRGDFTLRVRITRRPAEVLAEVTGYALPLAGILDLHARLAWDFKYAGVRSVQVRVPKAQAELFYFDAPQIAEKTLADDIWTLTFQKDLTGPQNIAVSAQVPVTRSTDDPSRFTAAVPVIEPLGAQRISGTWAIEANTDTEIQLKATGMNELDALLVPTLPDYKPRHRVIGVFTWLGPQYTLELAGVRHAGAGVLTTVVDHLQVDSVVATSGVIRTEAALQLRTAGAQFLDVTLPTPSRLLSLLVDETPNKQVKGKPGDVRVQLPAKQNTTAVTAVRLFYETAATAAWSARGDLRVAPPDLPREIPVLKTTWHTYLPQGYFYSAVENNLAPRIGGIERPLLLAPFALWDLWKAKRAESVLGSAGVGDPIALEDRLSNAQVTIVHRSQTAARALQREEERVNETRLVEDLAAETASNPAASESSPTYPIQRKLYNIILPQVEFRDASLEEAVAFLVEKSRALDTAESDPARAGVKITIVPDQRRNSKAARITVALSNIPLAHALKYVTELAGRKVKVQSDRVEIVSSDSTESPSLHIRAWDVDSSRFSGLQAKDYLTAAGVTFPPGATAVYLPRLRKLSVKNTEENLNLVDAIVATPVDDRLSRTAAKESNGGAIEALNPSNIVSLVQRKLEYIILPRVELREASIREALDYLSVQSRKLDTNDPDPSKRGVNLILDLGAGSPGSAKPQEAPLNPMDARITVTLTNIPLGEALRYITNLAGVKFKVDQYAVRVVPLSAPTDTFITKEFIVPPGIFPSHGSEGGTTLTKRFEPRDYLMSSGITFPPGATATYLPGTNRLILRNTKENLDLLDAIVESSLGSARPLGNIPVAGDQARQIGLLPMKLDLPKSGEQIEITGLGAPSEIRVRYAALDARGHRQWVLFLVGVIAYLALKGRHPWWRTAWAVLFLSAVPLCLSPSATASCNLLLLGWLVALLIHRFSRRWIFTPFTEKPV